MATPRKHAEIIKAWADDDKAVIQVSLPGKQEWGVTNRPEFKPGLDYRIKPETVRYRRYLYKSALGYWIWTYVDHEKNPTLNAVETSVGFVRWIDTEWQEVEV